MTLRGTAQSAPKRLALDTSCVLNLLSRDEEADVALLRLFRFALQGRTTIRVTPIVEAEVPGHQDGDVSERALNRKFIRERLGMFAVEEIAAARQGQRDALAAQLLARLWPNVESGSRKWAHSLRDCQHIASLSLVGGGIFVSRDSELRRKAQARQDLVNVEVLSPDETLQRFPAPPMATSTSSSPIVRPARPDDAADISRLMEPIKSSYPNFDAWREKALSGEKLCFVAEVEGRIAGVAVWSKKDEQVVKLSTFYVGDEYQRRGIGPHLLFHQVRLWVTDRIQKVYVTVSIEKLHVLDFFFGYGFRLEGASTRRYKGGSPELILSKHFYYEKISDESIDSFLGRLSTEIFSLPDEARISDSARWFMPPQQLVLGTCRNSQGQPESFVLSREGHEVRRLSLTELEEIAYPARFHFSGREAFMIPIRPQWADAMMDVPRSQGSFFQNTDKLRLRTDNAFYCYPKMGPERLAGSPALFYVSQSDKFIAGCARILECRIAEPEDLFIEFGDIGIYDLDKIREHVAKRGKYAGCAMALKFAWWIPSPRPVTLASLRKQFELAHPQTVTPITYDIYESILEAGGIDW